MMSVRTTLAVMLMLLIAGGLAAQQTATTTAEPATGTSAKTTTATTAAPTETVAEPASEQSSYRIRERFSGVLRDSPPELASILVLDPQLLTNETFLASYPRLAGFVAEHPEVLRNPRFYLAEFPDPRRRESIVESVLEGLMIFAIFLLIAFALGWLVRTIIEQKRWNRLSRTQTEVHTKILDRFGTSAELLEYMRTPAGTKFLESAPIPLHAEPASGPRPLTRILLSIQIGVVVAAAAAGMLLVSTRFDRESAEGFFALGVIGFSIGAGFIGSAFVSLLLSRRLGLWQTPVTPETDSGGMR